jgi:hypothetical protein
MLKVQTFALAFLLVAPALGSAGAQQADMTFFVTSVGMGKGADLGGLQGADAYLSTQAADGAPAVNARDRVGKGPWQNVKGAVIGKDVADLHGANNNLNKDTALTEKGEKVNGRGDKPNMHDILTGTQPDGTAFPPGEDRTCGNWTKGGTEGAVMVGHHDRQGLDTSPPMLSWNSSHPSRGGCSDAALQSTGGAGLFYCFAAK